MKIFQTAGRSAHRNNERDFSKRVGKVQINNSGGNPSTNIQRRLEDLAEEKNHLIHEHQENFLNATPESDDF